MLKKVALVGLGGALGALMRYGFLIIFPGTHGAFPLTIFMENMVGSFLLGFMLILTANKWKPTGPEIAFLGTGLLGSFTTFSNFSMDLANLVNEEAIVIALVYMVLSITAGLGSCLAGMILARKWGARQ